jgi:hypothetical protein
VLCCVRWHVSLHRSHTQACRHGRGDAPVEAAARRAGAHVVGRLLLGRHGLLFLCVVEEGGGRENEAPGAGLCCGVMVAVYRRGQSAAAGSRHRDQVKLPSPKKTEANKTAWPLPPDPSGPAAPQQPPKSTGRKARQSWYGAPLPDPACACESCCGRAPASSQGRASCKESEAALPLPPQQARSKGGPLVCVTEPAARPSTARSRGHWCTALLWTEGVNDPGHIGEGAVRGKARAGARRHPPHTWQAAGSRLFSTSRRQHTYTPASRR